MVRLEGPNGKGNDEFIIHSGEGKAYQHFLYFFLKWCGQEGQQTNVNVYGTHNYKLYINLVSCEIMEIYIQFSFKLCSISIEPLSHSHTIKWHWGQVLIMVFLCYPSATTILIRGFR